MTPQWGDRHDRDANSPKLLFDYSFVNLTNFKVIDINGYIRIFNPLVYNRTCVGFRLQPPLSIIVNLFFMNFTQATYVPGRPKGTQRPSTETPRTPKGSPRVTKIIKRNPKSAQGVPKALQRHPKKAKGTQRERYIAKKLPTSRPSGCYVILKTVPYPDLGILQILDLIKIKGPDQITNTQLR
jgi:hypothetical protein